jgi:DUF4097 and DUF4098 domain-containing protein YvlB
MAEYKERFAIEGVRRIELKISRGDIAIERISGDSLEVESDSPVSIERMGSSIHIGIGNHFQHHRHHAKPPRFSGTDPISIGSSINELVSTAVESIFKAEIHLGGLGSADIRVGIPALLERPEIVVSTGAGEISMRGVASDCSLQSSSGEISVKESGGTLQVMTGMGDLEVVRFDGPVTARTGSGDANFEDCGHGAVVHTGSGDIRAVRIGGAWNVRSGAGDIDVRVQDDAALEIVTGAGDISVNQGSLSRLSVQSGSGDIDCTSLLLGPSHQLSTEHGDISVAIADPPGARMQVLTRHGDVDSAYPLVIVGKQGRQSGGGGRYVGNIGDSTIDVELRTASGDITIKRREPAPSARPERTVDWANAQHTPERPFNDSASDMSSRTAAGSEAGPVDQPPPYSSAAASAESFSSSSTSIDQPGWTEQAEPRAGQATGVDQGGNPRLAVLENLQAGKISISEAAKLLDALGGRRG